MAHDVFVSYATSDKAIADAVCSQLESIHRIRCWIAPRDVTPGANWAECIIDALDQSKIMVLIFSSNANASMQIEREVERAVHKGINIIPLRIENTTPTKTLEYFISAPHWLDAMSVPLELHIDKLATAVKSLLAKSSAATPQPLAELVAKVTAVEPAAELNVPATPVPVVPDPVVEGKAAEPAASRKWLVAAAAALIVGAAIIYGARSGSEPSPTAEGDSQPAATPEPAAPSADTTSAATSSEAVAPAVVAPAPTATHATTASPAAPRPAASARAVRSAAAPASAKPAVARAPNLLIDFRNTVDEGKISLEIDGHTLWSELLGKGLKAKAEDTSAGPGIPEGPVSAAVIVRPGAGQATVTLLNKDGKVRDTKAIDLDVAAQASARTLQIRLSRFKKDLELKMVDAPAADAEAPAGQPAGRSK
ncbi:MAG: toll/interleukin-1 receptor domain-containing protein [Vicinamibacterales bacterium]